MGPCSSYILLTQADAPLTPNLLLHLERTSAQVPSDIRAMAEQELKTRELIKVTPICQQMKMLGYCR